MTTQFSIGSKATVNSSKIYFANAAVTQETDKAFKFEVDDCFGSYLHEYRVSFWLPKSIVFKNVTESVGFGVEINLPHWFSFRYYEKQDFINLKKKCQQTTPNIISVSKKRKYF